MILIAAMLLQATAPSAEAEELGVRLARAGTLATIAPMLAAQDTEEMVKVHPELSAAEQEQLRATARAAAAAGVERISQAMGHAYATRLSLVELRTLVAAAENPAQRRFRAVLPEALAETVGALGELDFKRDTAVAFCRETGKLCDGAVR